jgi:AcrR family transcriptional regulator
MLQLFSHGGKKGDILKASLALFAAKGYDAVSVRDIAKAAGVSEAALYKHFSGKEDMALFIFRALISDYTERLRHIAAGGSGAVAKLCRIVEVTYDLYREGPAEIRFALLSQYQFWNLVPEDIKPHFVLRSILEEGMDRGEIPRQGVYFWITVYSGIMLQPLAQYPYFADVLPEFDRLKAEVVSLVRKLFC